MLMFLMKTIAKGNGQISSFSGHLPHSRNSQFASPQFLRKSKSLLKATHLTQMLRYSRELLSMVSYFKTPGKMSAVYFSKLFHSKEMKACWSVIWIVLQPMLMMPKLQQSLLLEPINNRRLRLRRCSKH